MEQICECDYSSLSCFLQLENLDTDNKQTTPMDSIFQDVSVRECKLNCVKLQ